MRISESKSAMKINWNMINMIEQVFQATYVATLHYQPFSRLHSWKLQCRTCQSVPSNMSCNILKERFGKENWISLPHTDGGVKAKDGISLLNFCSDKLLVLLTPYKTTVTIMCVQYKKTYKCDDKTYFSFEIFRQRWWWRLCAQGALCTKSQPHSNPISFQATSHMRGKNGHIRWV